MPLQIVRRDITTMRVDAIVNTTNENMIGYSGVDRLVHKKAGPELDRLCGQMGPLELGFARVTPGFNLECRYIIHTSGPVWHGGRQGERAILRSCYLESLKLAKEHGCQSIAFPLISSGAYHYPKDQVLHHAVQVISEFLQDNEMDVFLCVYDPDSYEFSRHLYADICSFISCFIPGSHPQAVTVPVFPTADKASAKATKPPKIPRIRPQREEKAAETVDAASAPLEECKIEFFPPCAPAPAMPCPAPAAPQPQGLEEFLQSMDAGFAETLFRLIDQKGMTDVACYKKANVDKKTFSKIKCNPTYKPSKPTAIAFAIALELNLDETRHLLQTAGLALSHSNKFDLIIEYFIIKKNYDIFTINEALFAFDQMLLGC